MLLLALTLAAFAQDAPTDRPAQLADAGEVEALEALLKGDRAPESLRLLARAAGNRALRVTGDANARQTAFAAAEKRYQTWHDAVVAGPQPDSPPHRIAVATVLGEMGGLLLSRWATPDLDEFEISSGLRFDRARLAGLLERARDYYERAAQRIAALVADIERGAPDIEEQLLADGVYDALLLLNLDLEFNRAYANLYLGLIEPQPERRSAALHNAEHGFRKLLDANPSGLAIYRVNVGLGITLREQRRFDEAQRAFAAALEGAPLSAEAHVRNEQARCYARAGNHEAARVALRPMIERDPDALAPDDRPARFYLNMAHLLDAYSYLLEAEELRRAAGGAVSAERARRARESGLIRMNRLAARGGPWPGVVQVYVSANIRPDEDPRTLSAIELLFTARQLSAEKRYAEAAARLEEARTRTDVGRDVAGEVMFELAVCCFRREELRRAAALFDEFAIRERQHDKAPQAIGYAYQIWSQVAEASGEPADYGKLADTLATLLQHYPNHERRRDATWWLPLALQSARRFGEASDAFARVPRESVRWEEAQFRRVVCLRQAVEAQRASLSTADFARRAEEAIGELRRYAGEALARSAASREPLALRNRAAEARLHAAELLAAPEWGRYEEALRELDEPRRFEERFPGTTLLARVLAVRMRCERGLRRFDRAVAAVEEYIRSAGSDQAMPTLAALAGGMHAEVERLLADGRPDEARLLAASGVQVVLRLDLAGRGAALPQAEALTHAAARICHVAGKLSDARALAERLLAQAPANGSYLRLHAQILTDELDLSGSPGGPDGPAAASRPAGEGSAPEALLAARRAWEKLLADATLKQRAPARYWEARYHQLALLLRSGAAAEVERAIRSERAWDAELGGPPWRERLEQLRERAAGMQSGGAEVSPSADPRP